MTDGDLIKADGQVWHEKYFWKINFADKFLCRVNKGEDIVSDHCNGHHVFITHAHVYTGSFICFSIMLLVASTVSINWLKFKTPQTELSRYFVTLPKIDRIFFPSSQKI